MGRPKALTLQMKIDVAQRGHTCQHNEKHVINKGDRRLKVKAGRSFEHYCVACATKFIALAMEQLGVLDKDLHGA